MATGSSRDVKMVLSVESLGQENITKLEKSLRDLAAAGGTGTDEFTALADQIGRLGAQNETLASIKTLTDQVDTLTEKQALLSTTLDASVARLAAARTATEALTAKQKEAREALTAGEKEYIQAGLAIKKLAQENSAADKKTAEYTEKLKRLTDEQGAARVALVDLREANRLATQELTSANAELSKAETANKRAERQFQATSATLQKQVLALKEVGDTARELGVDTEDLSAAETQLLTVYTQGVKTIQARTAAAEEMREADRLLAIEAKGMEELYRKGALALQAEILAQRDATKAVAAYEAAKKKALEDKEAWQREAFAIVELAEAQQRTKKEAEDLAASLQEVAASEAFAKQAEEAQRLVKAAEYTKFWTEALDEADAKLKELGQADAFDKQAEKAKKQLEAAEYTRFWTEALDEADAKLKELAASEAFDRQAEKAKKQLEAAEYTRFWTQALDEADAKLQELAASEAFAKQAEEAQRLVKAAEYTRFWADALDEVDANARKVTDAFAQIDTRSVEEVKAEIDRTNAAMTTLAQSGKLTGAALDVAMQRGQAKVAELERDVRELTGALTFTDKAANVLKNSMGQIAIGNLAADAIASLVERVKEMGRAFIGSIVQLEQMRRGLNAVYKDAATTASQIVFLRRTASEAGVSFGGLSSEFVKFTAAMTGSNIPLAESNALFAAVTKGAAALGLGAEATAGSLNALGQIASKGTVSMEELRQQLGDRFPGVFSRFAQELGVTEAALVKLVESGTLAARDAFPALTRAMSASGETADGLVPTFERFKGVLTEIAQGIGDAGGTIVLTGALKVLGGTVGAISLGLSVLVEALFLVGSGVTALAGLITGNTKAFEFFGEQVSNATTRLTAQAQAFNAMLDPANNVTQATQAASNANKELATALDTAKTSADLNTLALKMASGSVVDLSANLVQYNAAAAGALKTQQQQTLNAEKQAKATKEEGDSLIAIASLRGSEIDLLNATAQAANNLALAEAKVLTAKKEEVTTQEQWLAYTVQNLQARGRTTEEIEKETSALRGKLDTARAELEQSASSADAARVEALQRQLAVETIGDQSAKISELAAIYQEAQRYAVAMATAEEQGSASRAEVVRATEQASTALFKYRDAQADATRNAELLAKQLASSNDLALATLNLEKAQLVAAGEKAKADGNEFEIRKNLIAQKELDIRITKLSVEAKIAETNAQIAALALKKEEIALNDPLRVQKIAQIDLSIKAAEVAILQAKAQGESVAAMERELKALRNNTAAKLDDTTATRNNTDATMGNVAAKNSLSDAHEKLMMKYTMSHAYTQRQIELLEEEAAAQQKLVDLELKRLNIDKEKFSLDAQGNRISQAVGSRDTAAAKLEAMGVDPATAKKLAAQVYDERGNYTPKSSGAYRSPFDTEDAVLRRLADQQSGAQKVGAVNYTIQIGSRSRTVGLSSQDDANALTSVLRDLENASGTAT